MEIGKGIWYEKTCESLFGRAVLCKLFTNACVLVKVCVRLCMFVCVSVPVNVVHSLQENLHYNES